MPDKIEKLHGSLIHHGPLNQRIYVLKYHHEAHTPFLESLLQLAQEKDYGKIIMKIPESQQTPFLANGFEKEAEIPGYFYGEETVAFLAKYLKPERKEPNDLTELRQTVDQVIQKRRTDLPPIKAEWECRLLNESDIPALQKIYQAVFPSYPFPIHKAEYLQQTMNSHVAYFGIFENGQLMAAASCEMDKELLNVEMTDFATYREYRGNGLASILLNRMEKQMKEQHFQTAYTIARAVSYGMNRVFANGDYQFGGTLLNNTNIGGQIESMNIWHKPLST